MQKKIFTIFGMTCMSCAMRIDGELEDSGKIKEAKTSYLKQQTEITYDPKEISDEEILELIKKAGYDAAIAE